MKWNQNIITVVEVPMIFERPPRPPITCWTNCWMPWAPWPPAPPPPKIPPKLFKKKPSRPPAFAVAEAAVVEGDVFVAWWGVGAEGGARCTKCNVLPLTSKREYAVKNFKGLESCYKWICYRIHWVNCYLLILFLEK